MRLGLVAVALDVWHPETLKGSQRSFAHSDAPEKVLLLFFRSAF